MINFLKSYSLNEIGMWPRWLRGLIIGIICFILLIFIYFFYLKTEIENLSQQEQKIQILQHKLVAQTAPKPSKATYKPSLSVFNKRCTANFDNMQLIQALQLLAQASRQNLILSPAISGTINLHLTGVDCNTAVAVILKSQGLSKQQWQNIIYVAPVDEITLRNKQIFQEEEAKKELQPIQSLLIPLKYSKATDMVPVLKDKLSSHGNLSADARTNCLWIEDTATHLATITKTLNRLDVPVKQILIEARIVNVDTNYEKELGVRFGSSGLNHFSGTLNGANALNQKIPNEITPADRLNVNLPALTDHAASCGLALARLGKGILLDLELSAMESLHAGEVISAPKIITSDQQSALIQSGEEIPYQESVLSGGTSTAFKKAVLSLQVIPQITPDHKILMSLKVNQDKRGQTTNGVPAIDTRQIETQAIANNGETIALGGIYDDEHLNTTKRVPYLGQIPIIGFIFRYKDHLVSHRELIIFITPSIITH